LWFFSLQTGVGPSAVHDTGGFHGPEGPSLFPVDRVAVTDVRSSDGLAARPLRGGDFESPTSDLDASRIGLLAPVT